MQKINFQNLPSTSTPLNATNLNDLQDNVEDAINGVYEEGTWTPHLENCTYTPYVNVSGKYIKIGKMVIATFHDRPNITAITGNGNAIISGLPYTPTWPQLGSGSLGACQITDTSYIPVVSVSNSTGIELVNNITGANIIKWKVSSGWIDGVVIYSTN